MLYSYSNIISKIPVIIKPIVTKRHLTANSKLAYRQTYRHRMTGFIIKKQQLGLVWIVDQENWKKLRHYPWFVWTVVKYSSHKWPKQIPSSASCRPQKRRRDVFFFCLRASTPQCYMTWDSISMLIFTTRGQTSQEMQDHLKFDLHFTTVSQSISKLLNSGRKSKAFVWKTCVSCCTHWGRIQYLGFHSNYPNLT